MTGDDGPVDEWDVVCASCGQRAVFRFDVSAFFAHKRRVREWLATLLPNADGRVRSRLAREFGVKFRGLVRGLANGELAILLTCAGRSSGRWRKYGTVRTSSGRSERGALKPLNLVAEIANLRPSHCSMVSPGPRATLQILPCLDSDELAAARRRELDIPRDVALVLGRSAVAAARAGRYRLDDDREVEWADAVRAAVAAKVSIPPDAALPAPASTPCAPASTPCAPAGTRPHLFAPARTRVTVTNETTLGASRRLMDQGHRPLALNFANGIHPGGGFLTGSRAQEEVLCRSSALYLTLEGDPMHEAHARRPRPDSTDWAILSPEVPVFRTDDGRSLEQPWLLDVITSAAPVAHAIGQPEAGDLLRRRIHRVLAIAQAYGYTALVLGAWGCGAFANDPARTAADFRDALAGEYAGAFDEVVFAITDWSAERRFLGPFRDVMTRGAAVV